LTGSHIAAVSQVTLEERKAMTAPDGSLKPEYYNRVVTFRGQQLSDKSYRFRHAVFVGWREDKTPEQCDGYELAEELRTLGFYAGQELMI
jgi:ATP-dependent DNA ligase